MALSGSSTNGARPTGRGAPLACCPCFPSLSRWAPLAHCRPLQPVHQPPADRCLVRRRLQPTTCSLQPLLNPQHVPHPAPSHNAAPPTGAVPAGSDFHDSDRVPGAHPQDLVRARAPEGKGGTLACGWPASAPCRAWPAQPPQVQSFMTWWLPGIRANKQRDSNASIAPRLPRTRIMRRFIPPCPPHSLCAPAPLHP